MKGGRKAAEAKKTLFGGNVKQLGNERNSDRDRKKLKEKERREERG